MKRIGISFLAIALATATGMASAQSYGDRPYGDYGDRHVPEVYRGGDYEGARYDYARVLRVDPVIVRGRGYPTRNGQRCETRRDGYAGGGYRDDYYLDGYGDGYGDRYRRDEPYRDTRLCAQRLLISR